MAVGLIVILLMAAQLLFGLGFVVFNTGQLSMRQAITPDDLQGRMNARMNFIVGVAMPLGDCLAGFWVR